MEFQEGFFFPYSKNTSIALHFNIWKGGTEAPPLFVSSADTRQAPSHQPWALWHTCHWQEGKSWPAIKPSVSICLWLCFSCRLISNVMHRRSIMLCGEIFCANPLPSAAGSLHSKSADSSCNERSSPAPSQTVPEAWKRRAYLPPPAPQSCWAGVCVRVRACCIGSVSMARSCWIISCNIIPVSALLWLRYSSGCFKLWCAYSWETADFSVGNRNCWGLLGAGYNSSSCQL